MLHVFIASAILSITCFIPLQGQKISFSPQTLENMHVFCKYNYLSPLQDLLLEHYKHKPELINTPSSCSSKKNSFLHIAAKYGQSDIIHQLLKMGGQINVVNVDGDTPLHLACKKNRFHAVRVLLLYGADVTIENNAHETPYDIAKKSANQELIKLFIQHQKKTLPPSSVSACTIATVATLCILGGLSCAL